MEFNVHKQEEHGQIRMFIVLEYQRSPSMFKCVSSKCCRARPNDAKIILKNSKMLTVIKLEATACCNCYTLQHMDGQTMHQRVSKTFSMKYCTVWPGLNIYPLSIEDAARGLCSTWQWQLLKGNFVAFIIKSVSTVNSLISILEFK